ncbi:MAG: ribosomal L7Ae/L30e/S12e/Gadd45 family protein [Ruminococcus sp.]|nr:ribosomal L7Ae/L30e/S12e/Gadd45 family protein [Ruminococcus sp.]
MNGSKEKFFGLLTICRKAGKMTMGFDSVKESILSRKACTVILSSDISAKTEKEIRFFAEKSGVRVINASVTMTEIELGTGKKAGVIGICGEGFAKRLTELAE